MPGCLKPAGSRFFFSQAFSGETFCGVAAESIY